MATMVLATRVDQPQYYGQGIGPNRLELHGMGVAAGKESGAYQM